MSAPPLRILLSYAYFADADIAKLTAGLRDVLGADIEFFCDSGAFTAHEQGKTITVEQYGDWLDRWGDCFVVRANLDEIGNAEGSWRNWQALRARGHATLATVHAGAPVTMLERYLDEGQVYIALGGIASARTLPVPWIATMFQAAKGRAVFHGYGVSSVKGLRLFPWYSVDSSSWLSGARYAQVTWWCDRTKRFRQAVFGQGFRSGLKELYAAAPELRALGFDLRAFAGETGPPKTWTREHQRAVVALKVASTERFLAYVRKLHGPIAMPGNPEAEPGIVIYHGGQPPSLVAEGYREILPRLPDLRDISAPLRSAGLHLYYSSSSNLFSLRIFIDAVKQVWPNLGRLHDTAAPLVGAAV